MKRINFNESWTVRKTSGGSDVFKEATPVTLPHDAMIMEKRTPEAAGGAANGFFPGGDYEYAKKFTIPEENRGKTHFLQFEGIMSEAKIYVNQSLAASTYYGYTGKVLDITPYLLEDGENTVLVKVFAKDPGSRWYTGAGIYRPVSLYVGRDIRIPVRGVRVTTPVAEEAVSCVQIRTALVCILFGAADAAQLRMQIAGREYGLDAGNAAYLYGRLRQYGLPAPVYSKCETVEHGAPGALHAESFRQRGR